VFIDVVVVVHLVVDGAVDLSATFVERQAPDGRW
jgi:hypothetical protein